MIEQLTREVILEHIEKLERHSYSPEQNKIHYTGLGNGKTYYVPQITTIEEAVDKIMNDGKELDRIAFLKFEAHYIKYKLLNGIHLTEEQLKFLIFEEVFEEVDRDEGDNRRWSRSIYLVFKVDDRYFSVDYEEGLTEMQPNEYSSQPVEVSRHEEVVTKTVVTYKPIVKE